MIAAYMKKEGIRGKVIILNPSNKIAKGAAFKEAWKELYGDIIEHIDFATIQDVDPVNKTVTYHLKDDMADNGYVPKAVKYEVLNLIPNNMSNPVVDMSGVETTTDSFKKVAMNGCSFQTKTDQDVYAVGDVVAHGIPPSGQTANWAGKQCADEIAHRLHGKSYELPVKKEAVRAGNVCYSMVGDKPEEAIMVTHDFSWNGTVIKGKGHVPKAPSGKFRSDRTARATRDWYGGIMRDLFT
jgi:pyruvate/2-oxoglutarate dehydrogenase complex dihydrolipoamide dehydrogenase (E3) component